MDQNDSRKYYNDILKMAREIAVKLGKKLIRDGYYDNEYYGNEYTYDNLKIYTCYDNLDIYISDERVFNYAAKERTISYKKGKWPELIQMIYNQLPGILKERELENARQLKKAKELQGLENYFKHYMTLNGKKNGISEILNANLNAYGISANLVTRYSYIRNLVEGYDMPHPYDIYVINYNEEKVAEFRANYFDIFPNFSWYLDAYKPGEWTKIFKHFINKAIKENEKLVQQTIDNSTDEMIKNLKKLNR